jgi:hypothetical protein
VLRQIRSDSCWCKGARVCAFAAVRIKSALMRWPTELGYPPKESEPRSAKSQKVVLALWVAQAEGATSGWKSPPR